MELEQARNILITFNRWRRGEDVEPMLEPSDIGKAIDVAIQHLDDTLHTFKLMEGVKKANEKLMDRLNKTNN